MTTYSLPISFKYLMRMGIKKEQLSKISGVSTSLISDLTNGKGNPSLRIMERIADALNKPLIELIEETDLDSKSLEALASNKPRGIAEGYERISLILSSHQAFITRPWTKDAMEKLKKQKAENEKNPRKPQNNK
jgi:transcriptional regulator with XRE-family HTH domain